MSEKLETLRGIAALICELDRFGGDCVERVTQQLRGLHNRRLLKPTAAGARDAWLFGLHEACRARILLELIDLGIVGDAIHAALDGFNLGIRGAGDHPATMLGEAIRRARAGKQCVLEVFVIGTPDKGKTLRAAFDWPGRTTKDAKRILATRYPETIHATVTIPVTDLLRPLIEKFEGE